MKYKNKVEKIFEAWTTRDWDFYEAAIAEDFTFTSQYDDRLTIDEFKKKCWDKIEEIGEFEIVGYAENDAEAFVRYKNTIDHEKVQNTEHFVFDEDEQLKSVTVFFGRPE